MRSAAKTERNKTMFKKLLCVVACCLLFGMILTACANTNDLPEASDTTEDTGEAAPENDKTKPTEKPNTNTKPTYTPTAKEVDIYIIAGQSNGSGYTKYDANVLKGLWDKYDVGAPSVLYTGRAEYTNNVNTANVSTGVNEVTGFVPAKAGLGRSAAHMGAEVGMAKVLSEEYYTPGSGKNAVILKYAHGGTSLLNTTGGENAANGNWVSPSYATEKGYTYSGVTGGLYRKLLDEVKVKKAALEDMGYKVNIKGLFWMQGESDKGNPEEYGKAFKHFVNDIRKDLGVADLPIMIGEISETFGAADEATIASNKTFIAKQRALANEIKNCYAIASSKYPINRLENGVSVNDQDKYHWTTANMFAIGELVGKCIVNNIV